MRPRPIGLTIATVATALSLAACAAASEPGWTYAPPTASPSPGPVSSAVASAAPSAIASAVASAEASGGAPSGAASEAPSGGAAGGSPVVITALNIQYTEHEANAPASAPFVIHFRNEDAGTPHNVEIKDASGMSMFKGDIVNGVIETDYQVPALAPGTYQFVCSVHPTMVGQLKVGG